MLARDGDTVRVIDETRFFPAHRFRPGLIEGHIGFSGRGLARYYLYLSAHG